MFAPASIVPRGSDCQAMHALTPQPMASEAIVVQSLGAELVQEGGKPHRVYSIAIEAGGARHVLCGRFSALKANLGHYLLLDGRVLVGCEVRLRALQGLMVVVGGSLGGRVGRVDSFPSRHVLRNYTTNEANVAQRAEHLRMFVQLLLADTGDDGALISDPWFHAMALNLQVDTPLAEALTAIGSQRRLRAEEAREGNSMQAKRMLNPRHGSGSGGMGGRPMDAMSGHATFASDT